MKLGIMKIVVGIYFIVIALVSYEFKFLEMYEMTCLSNIFCGGVLIVDGVLNICKKNVHVLTYLLVVPFIIDVFFCCFINLFGIAHFNFDGGFLFLHAINPIIMVLFYLFTAKDDFKELNKKKYLTYVFVSPSIFMCYLLFDLIYFFVDGKFIYGLVESDYAAFYILAPIAIVLYALMILMAYGLIELKKYTNSKLK